MHSVGTFGRLALVVLAPKVAWLLLFGVRYEIDSATYLHSWIPFHHPPLYSFLLHGFLSVLSSAVVLALLQAVLIALGATLLVLRLAHTRRQRYALAAILGLEPVSAFFAANLLSEALFIALLLPWTALLLGYFERRDRAGQIATAAWLGLLTGLLYQTRLVAVILPGYFLLLLLALSWRSWKRVVVDVLVLIAVFQVATLPVRSIYLEHFGSFSVSLYSGVNLWNNASPLYPDSSVRRSPRTEFERFLAGRDTGEFTTRNALLGQTIHGPRNAYHEFLATRGYGQGDARSFERELARTSRTIILESPLAYFTKFVVPNYFRTLRMDEPIVASREVDRLMRKTFGYVQARSVTYRSWVWASYVALLLAATVGGVLRGPRRNAALVLGLCWFYALVVPVLAASFLRYMLVLAPLIVTGAWTVVTPLRAEERP